MRTCPDCGTGYRTSECPFCARLRDLVLERPRLEGIDSLQREIERVNDSHQHTVSGP